MARVTNRSAPVCIVLPDENFEQIVKTIYSYLPYQMRAFSGYQTNTANYKMVMFIESIQMD